MRFELLDPKKHDRNDFDCGVEALNYYLQRIANQDQKRSLTKVYILSEEQKIIGYYTISAHSVSRGQLPEDQQIGGYGDLPFLLLGRLAIDRRYQGMGFGDTMIHHAFKTTLTASEMFGIMGMIVDAKDEKVAIFYEKFGFLRLMENRKRLVLPLSVIKNHVLNID